MDEKEEEEHSPLISVMLKLAGKKSASKPVEQSTKDETALKTSMRQWCSVINGVIFN